MMCLAIFIILVLNLPKVGLFWGAGENRSFRS